jgi:hypothetical protein
MQGSRICQNLVERRAVFAIPIGQILTNSATARHPTNCGGSLGFRHGSPVRHIDHDTPLLLPPDLRDWDGPRAHGAIMRSIGRRLGEARKHCLSAGSKVKGCRICQNLVECRSMPSISFGQILTNSATKTRPRSPSG